MNQKAISPLFKQAISAVKKQVDTLDTGAANIKKNLQKNKGAYVDNQFDDMSSGEQERLKDLGVDLNKTKKIAKQQHSNNNTRYSDQKQWKHDKYRPRKQQPVKPRLQPYKRTTSSFSIRFPVRQQYNKIYQLVKSQKAFIEQINEHCIKFTKEFAFNTCKKILKSSNIEFEDDTEAKLYKSSMNGGEKESIFDRLK